MLDTIQNSLTNHHDENNDNTIFEENKEHEKALAHCSQPVLLDKTIDLIDEAGSHVHIKAFNRRRQCQTYILSNFPNEYWHEILIVKKFHETTPTRRSNQYLLNRMGRLVMVLQIQM